MEKTELAEQLAREDVSYRRVAMQAVEDFFSDRTEAFGKIGTAPLAMELLPLGVDFTLQKRLCNTLLNLAKEGKVDRYAERGPERQGKGPMTGKTVRPWLWHAPVMVLPIAVSREPSQLDRIEQSLGRIEELLTREWMRTVRIYS